MKPNVEIRNGRLEIIEDLKVGSTLLHADFPLGMAMHDMEKGGGIIYDANENTEDVAIKVEWEWLKTDWEWPFEVGDMMVDTEKKNNANAS